MSITELIREVYTDTDYSDPSDIADEVLARTDQEDVFEYYKGMLRGAVNSFLSAERRRVRDAAIQEKIESGEYTPKPKNTRADQVRSWWADFKRQVIHTESGAKNAGDCTADDWMFAASQLRANAKAQERLADQYDALARLVGDGVTADLPEEKVRAVF